MGSIGRAEYPFSPEVQRLVPGDRIFKDGLGESSDRDDPLRVCVLAFRDVVLIVDGALDLDTITLQILDSDRKSVV